MKAVTKKMLVTFVGVVLAAPFLALALVVGARAVSLSQGAQDDLLLLALALGWAAASVVNGFNRRADSSGSRRAGGSRAAGEQPAPNEANAIGLGY